MNFGAPCEERPESTYDRRMRKRAERPKIPERYECFERLVQLCAIRDRSTTELRTRLNTDGYSEGEIDASISRAVECGLVDDMRFADALIRGKMSVGKGVAGIERELLKHGIDPDGIEAWPACYGLDDSSEIERACSYLQNHPPKAKDAWAAGCRKLLSRGYSTQVAYAATRLWLDSFQQSSDA